MINEVFWVDIYAGLRMNKSLYSLSYTCVTAGTAGLFFTGIDLRHGWAPDLFLGFLASLSS